MERTMSRNPLFEPRSLRSDQDWGGTVNKAYTPTDVLTKVMYLYLAAAVVIFVGMLLLTRLHP